MWGADGIGGSTSTASPLARTLPRSTPTPSSYSTTQTSSLTSAYRSSGSQGSLGLSGGAYGTTTTSSSPSRATTLHFSPQPSSLTRSSAAGRSALGHSTVSPVSRIPTYSRS